MTPATSSPSVGWGRGAHGGEEDGGDVDARDAVDEGVVGLGDEGEPLGPVGGGRQPLNQVDLPERLGAVEPGGEDPGGESGELRVRPGVGECGVPQVVEQVEARVVYPDRSSEAERNLCKALAIARHEVKALADRVEKLVVIGG
jgi:hypothetical protein